MYRLTLINNVNAEKVIIIDNFENIIKVFRPNFSINSVPIIVDIK